MKIARSIWSSRALAPALAGVLLAMPGWCVFESSANAAVEVLTESFRPGVAGFTDREIAIPQFDSSLGTLEAVTIDLVGTGAFVQGFGHSAGVNRQLSMSHNLDLLLEQGDHEVLLSLSHSANLPGSHSGQNGRAGEGGALGGQTERFTFGRETTLSSKPELTQFTGSGVIDLFLSTRSANGNRSFGRDYLNSGFWTLAGDVKVSYDYVPAALSAVVPEPSTRMAAGFAIMVLVCIVWLNRSGNQKGVSNL